MFRILILIPVLLCAACTDSDWAYVMPGSSHADYPADTPHAVPPPSAAAAANYAAFAAAPSATGGSAKCTRVARERMSDAEFQGFDDGVQQRVYDNTFADCMHWSSAAR